MRWGRSVADPPDDPIGVEAFREVAERLFELVDANGNGAIDICESALASCPADFDQNGQVNGADLAQLLNAWGPAPGLPGLDLNPDGVINGADLAILLNAWGVCAE